MNVSLSSSSLTHRPQSQSTPAGRSLNAFAAPPQPSALPIAPRITSSLGSSGSNGLSSGRPVQVVAGGGTAYEAMCKKVLQRRLVRVFGLSFVATLAITSCSLAFDSPFKILPSLGSSLTTLLATLLIFALAILPTLVLRKMLITQSELSTKSLWSRIQTLAFVPSSHQALLIFSACAFIQALVWSIISELQNPENKLGFFASTTKHPFHLNERLILVLLSSLSFGATYASKELVVQAFLPRWPRSLRPLSDLITNRLLAVPSLLSIALPVVHTVVFSFVYWLVRRSVWRFVLSWFGILTRPYIAYFVRASWQPLTTSLMVKMVVLESAILLGWEVGKAVLEIYMVQPMLISEYSASPVKCLLAGLSSPSAHIRHFAQTELTYLATSSSQPSDFRKTIFTDLTLMPSDNASAQNMTATAWQEVWRKELLVLGKHYRTLERRGAPPSLSSSGGGGGAASGGGGSQSADLSVKPATTLKPRSDPGIFLKPRTQALDAIAAPTAPPHSSLQLPPAPPQYRNTAPPPAEPSRVPKIFTSLSKPSQPPPPSFSSSAPSSGGQAPVPPAGMVERVQAHGVRGFWWVWGKMPSDVREVAKRRSEWVRRILWREQGRGWIRASLPGRRGDLMIVEALCALLTHSISEDPYGQIQRSIPQTLEALLSLHSALLSFQSQLRSLALNAPEGPDQEEGKEEIENVLREEGVEQLLEGVREGLREVVGAFGESLGALKLPGWVARGLEGFVV